jgi:predicted deacetylase
MPKYILRADDINPAMNWNNFNQFIRLCDKFKVKALLAVVPANVDKFMIVERPIAKKIFWQRIRKLQEQGYEIGLHGYKHHYAVKNRGILFLNNFSEFAGISAKIQEEKIRKAIAIFKKNKINSNIFVAPGHTFDWNTVKILEKYKIDKISDGISLYPYFRSDVLFVPVTLNGPRKVLLGVRTICMHLNSFNEKKFESLERFTQKNKDQICSFKEIVNLSFKKRIIFEILNYLSLWFKGYYYLRFFLEKAYSSVRK